ncbi:MAG: IscS subfamily cysteine desulfurase, partial [Syntrophobacterales bacterium]
MALPRERRALCGICPAGCWIIVTYDEEGKIVAVRADEGSPFGITCKLGMHSPEIVYSENRLRHPLKRKGPKGTYNFERISWDEAFEEIVTKLTAIKGTYGPEACAVYTGRGSFELAMCDVFQPRDVAVSSASSLLFPFGSPNTMGVGALCYVSMAMIAPHVTMGGMFINMFSDLEQAELIVVWGANPATDCPPLDYKRIIEACQRGAELVVIDPRRTLTAKIEGAQWIPIRPGTDGALALALCQVIIEEELYDDAFVREWTHGFEEFAQYVQHFRPEVAEAITGVPAGTMRTLARRLAQAHGAAPVMYSGLEYSDSGVQAIRATMVLWGLAGQLDVPGGRCFTMRENIFPINRAGSMITAWPQPEVWRQTLEGLDFLTCIDINLTADCAYADLVLPAATWYEIESYMTYGPIFRLRERVIEPVGEAKNAFFTFAELADRLGYGHLYPQNEEELLRYVLQGSSFSLDEVRAAGGEVQVPPAIMQYKKWEKGLLRPDGRPGFDTPTGKFEIASTILEEHGYDPLPVYTEPLESPVSQPELAQTFPLVFNSGARVTTDFRSQFHGIPGLVKQRPEPTVMLNTADAQARGIVHGDAVVLKSPRGQVRMRAIVTDEIVKGAVEANMGGGGPLGPQAWQDCNINDLTDLRYDPISGFPIYKALLCEVCRVANAGDTLALDTGEACQVPLGVRAAPLAAQDRIYLDHNATTPTHPEVQEVMNRVLAGQYGNPSSIYQEGRQAKSALEEARRKLANLLGITARRVIFTGGGSEANNLVIKSVALACQDTRRHIITSTIEHPSVLKVCQWLEKQGFPVTYLPVDEYGRVRPEDLEEALSPHTCLGTIMLANNETGSVQPIRELAALAQAQGALFHTDGVQAVGKIPVDVEALGVDFFSLSGHKFQGPKGIGALYVRKGLELEPLVHGGGQEGGRRAGTENTPGVVGVGVAAELAEKRLGDMAQVKVWRDELWGGIKKLFPEARLNGHPVERLPNTLNLSLPGIRGESLVLALDQQGISFSSGSACRSGSPKPSYALLAMGLTEEQAHCAIRLSLGVGTTKEHIVRTLAAMEK